VNPLAGAAAQRSRRLGIRLAPLRRQRRDLPRELAQALDRALRPHPRDRGSLAELAIELDAALDLVGDEPGVVDAPWAPLVPRPAQRSPAPGRVTEAADRQDSWAASSLHRPPQDDPSGLNGEVPRGRWGSGTGELQRPPRAVAAAAPLAWPPRAVAAAAAAGTAAWVAGDVLRTPPLPPAAFALLAAVATMLLPRLGWGAVCAGLCFCTLVAGHTGATLALVIALMAPVLLAPASPAIWPLAAGAPALGLVGLAGLAGAWPALAARAGTIWQRAVLASCGWLWLALAGALTGRALYLPNPPGAPAPDAWIDSAHQTVQRLLPSLVRTGALAPALVWAAAAVVAPWAARGRLPALGAIRVAVWAALLVAGTGAAITAAHSGQAVGAAAGAALGAVAAAAVALAPVAASRWRDALRSGGAPARLP
ncbi:MAG: serine/threonine-protein kinase, partial [Solirubrobacteraceae bacterium]